MRDFLSGFRPALVMMVLFTLLLGLAYPALVTGVAQLAFPAEANGELVRDAGGHIIGSELIGQGFSQARYFHGRPSAAGKGYDASSSGGSNLGPASKALVDRVRADVAAARKDGVMGPIPADMLTTSGSGLDPDISPETARAQVARVAAARKLPVARVRAVVEEAIRPPLAGILGEPHVNVLLLNRRLDAAGAQ